MYLDAIIVGFFVFEMFIKVCVLCVCVCACNVECIHVCMCIQ